MSPSFSEGRRRCFSIAICSIWLATVIAGVYGDCSAPPRLEYGELLEKFLSLEEFPVGTSVSYKCRPGYVIRSRYFKPIIKCLDTLKWSEIAEFCQLKDCGNPGEPSNGRVIVPEGDSHMPNTKFGSIVTFRCDTGFRLIGRNTRTCTASGWSNAVPGCEPVICPPPPEIANGRHTGFDQDEYYYLSGVTYSCNADYMELIGSRLIHCTETGDWSDPAPFCKDRRCPEPVVENGRKVAGFKSLYLLGNVVEFRCNEGFLTKDPQRVMCGEKNKWEPPVPVCQPVICTKPPAIVNGSHSGMDRGDFKYHEQVTYKCDSSDLSLIGHDTIQCVGEGEWSGPAPRCKAVLCEIPLFPNGTWNSKFKYPYRYKHTITLQCNEYFSPNRQYHVECNENSMWTPEPPVCKDLRCPNPVVKNGIQVSKRQKAYVYRNVVKFECNSTFKMAGKDSVRCAEGNEWFPALPVCRPIMCGKPPIIENGRHNRTNQEAFPYKTVVEYQCNSNDLSLIGRKTIRCTHSETWDRPAPVCKVVNCKDLQLENGKVTPDFQSPYKYGNTVYFECNKNFRLDGSTCATCGENSEWNTTLPTCRRTTCPDPVIQNGHLIGEKTIDQSYPKNTEIELACNPGYSLVGEAKMSCTGDFTWSTDLPTCSLIKCRKPEIEHGTISDVRKLKPDEEEYRYDDIVEITCKPNYTLMGNISESRCTNQSTWSSLPTCKPVLCSEPKIQNGRIIPVRSEPKKNYRVAEKAKVFCDDGYVLNGKNEIQCQQDSTWSSLPTCDFVCCSAQQAKNGQFGNIMCQNVKVEKPQSTVQVLDHITFQCDNGYVINSTNNFQCRTSLKPTEPAALKPEQQAEVPTQRPPKCVALGKHDLSEEEVLGLNQNTNISTSPTDICQFVAKSISENWEKMDVEEKYTHLQMQTLCREILEKKSTK